MIKWPRREDYHPEYTGMSAVQESVRYQLDANRVLIQAVDELRKHVRHADGCIRGFETDDMCTCGASAALRECEIPDSIR